MKITNWPVGKITPYANNPRVITPDAVDAVAAMIKQFGWLRGRPIVVDRDGVIIIGHTRRLAALKLGRKTVPVLQLPDLSADDARAARIVDNRTGQQTDFDYGMLAAELSALGEDISLLVGLWDEAELAALSAEIAAEVDATEPTAAPLAPGTAHPPPPAATTTGGKAAKPAPAVVCPNCGRPVAAA